MFWNAPTRLLDGYKLLGLPETGIGGGGGGGWGAVPPAPPPPPPAAPPAPPPPRTGFAHLFEHLMFQGCESLEKLAHFRHVQGSGGTFNGSTHLDYTDYFEVLPAAALERALFLEADRMRAPKLTAENLRNQVDVVKEEIRLNVLNRPYGGFPWILLPRSCTTRSPTRTTATATSPSSSRPPSTTPRRSSTPTTPPATRRLTVAGDLGHVDQVLALVEKHFGDIPARPTRAVPRSPSRRPAPNAAP